MANVTEKTVQVRIPALTDAPEGSMNFVPVGINGKIWRVKRGEPVEVPEQVAKILTESGYLDA